MIDRLTIHKVLPKVFFRLETILYQLYFCSAQVYAVLNYEHGKC